MWKREPIRMPKILQAAKGQQCTIDSPACNHKCDTVVACHSNSAEDGKGMGQKADDIFVAFGCSDCHRWLDEGPESKEVKEWYFHRGMKRTWRLLILNGILK